MKKIKMPVTVKEVSYHLTKEVDRLLVVHKKVSNPDFEAELLKNTGIGWKQVKNYKNHPKQFQIVNDNAKILEFVEGARSKDNYYQLKILGLCSSILMLILCLIWLGFKLLYNPTPATYLVVTNKLPAQEIGLKTSKKDIAGNPKFEPTLFNIPETSQKVRVGKIEDSGFNIKEFSCSEMESINSQNCQRMLSKASTLTFLISNQFVYKFTYLKSDPGINSDKLIKFYEEIKSKYKKRSETNTVYLSEKFENQNESLEILTKKFPDGRLMFFSLIIEVKRN